MQARWHRRPLRVQNRCVQPSLPRTSRPPPRPGDRSAVRSAIVGYAGAAVLCVVAALASLPLAERLDPSSPVLVLMLSVVLCAAWFGRGPALFATGFSVLLFNLVFVPPRYSLAVADTRFLLTFAVMLLVGLVVGQLTASLRAQAGAALERERRVGSLYAISRELGSALNAARIDEIACAFMRAQLGAEALLWVRCRTRELVALQPAPDALQQAAARVVSDDRPEVVGTGGSSGEQHLVVPLRGTMAVRGALAIQGDPDRWSADEHLLLDTCATLLGGALERVHYIEVARESAVQIEGERLRNSLLSAISHDLRTPLASLHGLAESLRLARPEPSAQQREIADAMAASARRMSALVNNLLDMARLEAGPVRINQQWQPAEEVVGSAIAAMGNTLEHHRLSVRVPDTLPLVRLDAVLMERVLVNLLENAIKYTPPGTRIELAVERQADRVAFMVSDEGPGLPAGRGDDLFRKFERGVRESATPGVGLGLSLCRAIAEAHGGRIDAESAPGGGARFVLRLPLGEPPDLPASDDLPPETA